VDDPITHGTMFIAVLGSEFVEQPQHTDAVAGEDITLDCLPPRGQPTPRVRWTKDNSALKPDADRVSVLPSGSLRIRDVKRQDAGSYVCIAYNIGGEKDSNAARLTVKGVHTSYFVFLTPYIAWQFLSHRISSY